MDSFYSNDNFALKPKSETIEFLLQYSKSMSIIKLKKHTLDFFKN